MATDNHNFINPESGATGWHPDWYSNFEELDRLAEIRGVAADRQQSVPKDGAKYFATDTEEIFIGTSAGGWSLVESSGKNPTFTDVSADSLSAITTESQSLTTSDLLTLPNYDDISNATMEPGALVYATGVSTPAGIYRSNGSDWTRIGDGGGGGDGGVSALSGLEIDTGKSWRGYNITNVGEFSSDTVTTGELDASSASVMDAPTLAEDVVRLTDIDSLADTPHGNEAHSEDYISQGDLGEVASDPHGNEAHSEVYATTTDVDGLAQSPHGNEEHSVAYAETDHDHTGDTLRPTALETGPVSASGISGSVAGGTTINDLAGDNLFIDADGSLNASGGSDGGATGKSHVNFVDIDDFGADPTGQSYSDSALSSAISALSDGDYLVMTNGDYMFREQHSITNDYITVTGEGSKITNHMDTYGARTAMLKFEGSVNSSGSPDTTNATTVREGDQEIVVENASAFSVGDDIIIAEQRDPSDGNSTHFRWGGQAGRTVVQTRSIVRAISGNSIYITRGSSYYHASGNAGVYRVDACKRPRVYDMHMRSGAGETFLQFYFTRNGHMERCYVQNCTGFAYQMFYGFRDTMVDCVSKHPTYASDRASSQQEHMRFVGGTDPVLVRPIVEDCRRGIDFNAGTHVAKIYEPLITNAQLHGICFHSQEYSGSDGTVRGAYEVYGGRIEGKQQRVTNDIYFSGLGVSMSPQQKHVKLVGTTIVGRSYAVHCPDYGQGNTCDNVTLIGCTFKSVPGRTSTLVRQGGSNWTIQGCTFEGSSGQNAIEAALPSSRSDVRIINNHIEGDVEMSGVTVNGYWFKNNYWDGSGSSPAGNGHYTSDNY